MTRLHLLERLRRSLAQRGIAGSLRHYSGRIYRIVRPERLSTHPFDLQHGVHTTALIAGADLATGHAHDIYSTCYLASHPSMVSSGIEAWRALLGPNDPPLESYTFFDLGAGMGRAVMVASLFPFRQVIGVEMNPRLCLQARSNFAHWLRQPRPCNDLQIANCDATEYPWPRAPIAIYMFNPFEEPVIIRLIESLEGAQAAGAGPIDILYIHPVEARYLETHPGIRLLGRSQSYLTEEERLADPYNDPKSEVYGVDSFFYRLVPD